MEKITEGSIVLRRAGAQTNPGSYPADITYNPLDNKTWDIAIGEHFLIFHFAYVNGFDILGKVVYFQMSIFTPTNATVTAWWRFDIPLGAIIGTVCPGILSCPSASVRNFSAKLAMTAVIPNTPQAFIITVENYAGMETNGYPTCVIVNNHDRFLKNSITNPIELDNSNLNDYFHSDGFSPYGKYKYAIRVTDTSNNEIVPLVEYPTGSITVKGKFYNQSFDEAIADIVSPVFVLKNQAGTAVVNKLSTFENTKVIFSADFGALTPKGASAYLIRTDMFDNALNFIDNYATGEATILTSGATAEIAPGIYSPSTVWTLDAGTVYHIDFHTDKTHIDVNGKYRIIIIAYSTTDDKLSSFISNEFSTDSIPTCTPITLTTLLKDMKGNADVNVITSVEDRLMFVTSGSQPNTDTYVAALIVKTAADLIIIPKSVQMQIYSVQSLGSTVKKDIFETQTLTFQGWLYDSIAGDFFADYGQQYASEFWGFNSINEFFRSADGVTMTLWKKIKYQMRMRYEANLPNVATYLNDVLQMTPAENQNWATRTLLARLSVVMGFSFTFNGFPFYYEDEIDLEVQILIRDYENVQGAPMITAIAIKKTDGSDITDICSLTQIRATATKDVALPDSGKLAVFIDNETYGIQNLQEEEIFVVDAEFTALTSPDVDAGSTDWAGVTAFENINIGTLTPGTTYRISIMYKQ